MVIEKYFKDIFIHKILLDNFIYIYIYRWMIMYQY